MHGNRQCRAGQPTVCGRENVRRSQEAAHHRELEVCRSTLARWLSSNSWKWRYFVTLTYRDARPRRLDFVGAQLLDTIRKDARGRAVAFICREFGGRSGRLHHHALLHGDAWSVSTVRMFWRSRYGHVDLRAYDQRRGAASYVAKYVLKEDTSTAEWSFFHRQPGDDIPLIPINKRRTGYEIYLQGLAEEEKAIPQAQATAEERQDEAINWLFPLTGKFPDGTKALRR